MFVSSLLALLPRSTTTLSVQQQPESLHSQKRLHLYGLRGILAICGVVAIFMQTFNPGLVWKDNSDSNYQDVLRIIFMPLVWDDNLISSFFLALSCHSIALRFLNSSTSSSVSGSIIRRVFRMVLPVTLSSSIAYAVFGSIGPTSIAKFADILPNKHIEPPQVPENALVALNAIFQIFWSVRDYYTLAANTFWPTQTLWNISLIFNQSWTVYFLMVILPYTRPGWHTGALSLFALGSFWMCSWGWYSAAALLLADYTTNPTLRLRLGKGLMVHKRSGWGVPYKFVSIVMIVIGFAFKFTWAALPQYYNKELLLHPYLLLSENTDVNDFAAGDPYPRVDNFFVIFGVLLLSETSVLCKRCLSNKPLVVLGKRSLSRTFL